MRELGIRSSDNLECCDNFGTSGGRSSLGSRKMVSSLGLPRVLDNVCVGNNTGLSKYWIIVWKTKGEIPLQFFALV